MQALSQVIPVQSFRGQQHFFLDGHWRTMNEHQEFIQMEDEIITLKYNCNMDSSTQSTIETSYNLQFLRKYDASIDYDQVTVYLKAGSISTIYPNPATNSITLSYSLSNVNNAQLLLLHPIYMIMDNIALNTSNTNQTIDISNLPTATYTAVLICDNKICSTKSFIKQ